MKKNDLHKIVPNLSEISPNKTGFKVPENYFKTIEDAIFAEIKSEIIKNKTSTVTKIFETPESYFETIDNNVLNKISLNPKRNSFKNNVIKFIAPIAIAASLLLIFILQNNSSSVTFDSLTISEIENWINNEGNDIDAFSIASILPNFELRSENYDFSITNDEFFEYLNNEDLEELIYEN